MKFYPIDFYLNLLCVIQIDEWSSIFANQNKTKSNNIQQYSTSGCVCERVVKTTATTRECEKQRYTYPTIRPAFRLRCPVHRRIKRTDARTAPISRPVKQSVRTCRRSAIRSPRIFIWPNKNNWHRPVRLHHYTIPIMNCSTHQIQLPFDIHRNH